ncbi:hypothetical protein [Paraburkholderia bonniea]|uniref:hypothetical protein n=1 Tax=Paraburkholderia bonniea TaxID=2152891 RepID=UPI001580C4FD|nr:hypothetical protein [Paraburkholderia bonniea]
MATTKKAENKTAKCNPNELRLSRSPDESAEQAGARIAASSIIRGAVTGRKYAEPMFGEGTDLTFYAEELTRHADAVKAGDLSAVEAMLMTQANTLDMVFNQLARKSAHCEYLNQMEANLRLALKAQAQCRSTLEALAEIKNPRPLAFVKQANIANGPQQVNNGPASRTHANNSEQSFELLERGNGEWLDTGATSQTSRGNQALETVGMFHRPEE